MEEERSPTIRVPVRINGILYQLLLDTGAHLTTLNASIVDQMNLVRAGKKTIVGFGGHSQEVEVVVADHVEVGDQYLKGVLVLKEPRDDEWMKFLKLDGVLGMDILKDFVVTIDCKNNKASLKKAE